VYKTDLAGLRVEEVVASSEDRRVLWIREENRIDTGLKP